MQNALGVLDHLLPLVEERVDLVRVGLQLQQVARDRRSDEVRLLINRLLLTGDGLDDVVDLSVDR